MIFQAEEAPGVGEMLHIWHAGPLFAHVLEQVAQERERHIRKKEQVRVLANFGHGVLVIAVRCEG